MARSSYKPVPAGLREIGLSPAMSAAMVEVAQRIASKAQAEGSGDYEAAPTTVTAGWANERRAGAVVRETRKDWEDTRDMVLVRVLRSMKMRGRT
jgi:hypothetical protein